MPFDISVDVEEQFGTAVDSSQLAQAAAAALSSERAPAGAALTVLVTGDETVRDLNRRFRGLDEPTDVLSFGETSAEASEEHDVWPDVPPGEASSYLGDIAVSVPYAERQAANAGHSLDAELAHLVVHGVLHLLGYDHAEPEEERVMRAREDAALQLARAAGG